MYKKILLNKWEIQELCGWKERKSHMKVTRGTSWKGHKLYVLIFGHIFGGQTLHLTDIPPAKITRWLSEFNNEVRVRVPLERVLLQRPIEII